MKVGFLGAGKMAQALAKGFVAAEKLLNCCVIMDVSGCRTTHDNLEVVEQSDVVVIATKPPVVPKVLQEVNPAVRPHNLMMSIALGIPIRNLEQMLPRKTRVIRVMPNTPSLVKAGCTVYSCGTSTLEDDGQLAKRCFSSVGYCEEVAEVLIDAVTGLSASGPAYIYLMIEALADGGVKMGIPRPLAYKLAAHTLIGGAQMVLQTGKHPGALKDDVCSPAGCTIEAMYFLERSGVRGAIMEAVVSAALKSKETGQRN
ncbi:pyrroline-5-carboxylate reductase 2-like isoform X2 [Pollicipes pollicipes]|uniref:pyrroline-5-carboxylate reductase 2-like isoform X2 n=1 Tax=Pollicipes pollicipes TaxID=41117 RepID=UPI0018851609|nr:pyrroline-5-carboxylate reductase 2-like isoform X2 [Pollicipes pollicipes]